MSALKSCKQVKQVSVEIEFKRLYQTKPGFGEQLFLMVRVRTYYFKCSLWLASEVIQDNTHLRTACFLFIIGLQC